MENKIFRMLVAMISALMMWRGFGADIALGIIGAIIYFNLLSNQF